jgi:SAM-dependent methyltransferase
VLPGREQLESFWEERGLAAAASEADAVCCTGAPEFLNRYVDRSQRLAMERLLAKISPLAGLRALDVGCGTGRWSRFLAAKGAHVTGVDRSGAMLAEARRRAPELDFRQMEATRLEFEADEFDLAAVVTVIQHLPHEEQESAIAELVRVVRPGGFVLAFDTDRKPSAFAARNGSFPRPRGEWRELWERSGADLVLLRGQEFSYPLRLARIGRRAESDREDGMPPSTRRGGQGWRREVLRLLVGASYVTEAVLANLTPRARGEHVAALYRIRQRA